MSFRNRCQIAGAHGVIDLSIPIVGGRGQKGLMRDVRIAADRTWQDQHWKTIMSCYSRSPWFDHYRFGLEVLYRKPVNFLMDWNQKCLEWSLGLLGMSPVIGRTKEYREEYAAGEAADWRGRLMPRDREKWGDTPRYHQVFEDRIGFIPHLSILDLLFCEGKAAIRYIRSSAGGRPSGVAAQAFSD